MNLTSLQKFKHDTIGKFAIIKQIIDDLSEESQNSNESEEIIEALVETFEKMHQATISFQNENLKNKKIKR